MLDNHLVELGTQGDLFCFVGCLKRRKEQSFANSPRVRYKPSSHPCGEKTLATTLCTWSPNVVTELLPSRTFSGTVPGELPGHITSTSTTSKKKLRIIPRVFSGAIFKLGEDLALWVFSLYLDLHCNLLFLVLSLLYLDLPLVFLLPLAFNFQYFLLSFIFSLYLLYFTFQFCIHSYTQKSIKLV